MKKNITYLTCCIGLTLLQSQVALALPLNSVQKNQPFNTKQRIFQSMRNHSNPACAHLQTLLNRKSNSAISTNVQNEKLNFRIKKLQQRCAMTRQKKLSAHHPRKKNFKNFTATNNTSQWQAINKGLDGGTVENITPDPQDSNTLYAATQGGLYKSDNKGNEWHLVLLGSESFFLDVAIDPKNSNNVLAASLGTIYKSTDAGKTWAARVLSSEDSAVSSIQYDPQHSNIVYASVSRFYSAGSSIMGMFKSTDGGTTWDQINNGIENPNVSYFLINPKNPNILYLSSTNKDYSSTLYKSIDAGKSWNVLSNSNFEKLLAIDPNNPTTLFAVIDRKFQKSNDGGESWTPIFFSNSKEDLYPYLLTIDPNDSQILYVAADDGKLYKSINGGESWARVSSYNFSFPFSITIDPTSSTIYTGNDFIGVVKSDDAGKTWKLSNKGMHDVDITAVSIDPKDNKTIFISTVLSIFKSVDGGDSWQSSFTYPITRPYERDTQIILDPNNSQILYSFYNDSIFYNGSILKSIDGGLHWTEYKTPAFFIESIAINPQNPKILFAATYRGIYKSTDAGISWTLITEPENIIEFRQIVIDPERPYLMYATSDNSRLVKSTDAGVHWNAIDVPHGSTNYFYLSSIKLDPNNSKVIYLGTDEDGVFKSTDGGKHWKSLNDGLNFSGWDWISDFAFDESAINKVYTAMGDGIYVSTNGGEQWQRMEQEGLGSASIENITVAPTNPSTLYAGTWNSGIYRLAP